MKKSNKHEPSSNESAEESFVLDDYTSDEDKDLSSNAVFGLPKPEGLSTTTTQLMEKSVLKSSIRRLPRSDDSYRTLGWACSQSFPQKRKMSSFLMKPKSFTARALIHS